MNELNNHNKILKNAFFYGQGGGSWHEYSQSFQYEKAKQAITEQVRLGRIDELESITGFSNIGGVYTKAGVDIKKSKGWRPIAISDRIEQLKKLEGKNNES